MKRGVCLLIALTIAGFGSFFNGLRSQLKDKKREKEPTTRIQTTLPPYIRPEGVHAAPDGTGKVVALTFDDGPSEKVTTHILEKLEKLGGNATFFCIGDRAEAHQKILEKMVKQNSEVASHSWSHERLTRLSAEDLRNDLEKTATELERYSGTRPKLMRPPFGAVSSHMRENTDFPIILWSIDSEDWRYCEQLCKGRSATQRQRDFLRVVNSVLDYVQDGDIVLMHDLYDFTQDVADSVINELHHQGWKFLTVSELFAQKEIVPKNGTVYHSGRD